MRYQNYTLYALETATQAHHLASPQMRIQKMVTLKRAHKRKIPLINPTNK